MLLVILFLPLIQAEKCHSIALSGGGSYGAYQAGVIYGLVHSLPAEDMTYNVVTGISAGALNSLGMVQYPTGEELAAADLITSVWSSLNGSSSVFQEWPGGYVSSILLRPSLVDTKPLRHLLNSVAKTIDRNITQGCTNLNTGLYEAFNETIGLEGIIEASMCSAAMPAVFPYETYTGEPLVDGGVVYREDFFSAADRCIEIAGKQEDVVVDMVETYEHLINHEVDEMNSINVLLRVNSINAFDHGMHNLYWAITAYPNVTFRYYLQPSKNLPGIVSLDFKDEDLRTSIEIGKEDAKYVVENKIYAKDVLNSWINAPKIFYA